LILDEPTNHLDIRYQIQILELVRSLGVTVIASIHDLNLASALCDELLLLDNGRCDIKIKIDLREAFSLQAHPQGNWQQHGERFECVGDFSARVDEDDLNELVLFVGHLDDLP